MPSVRFKRQDLSGAGMEGFEALGRKGPDFLAAGHHSADNVSQVGNKTAKFAPSLGIVDAATRSIVGIVPTAMGAHSVAVDGESHRVFVPHAPGHSEQFAGAGVAVFATE